MYRLHLIIAIFLVIIWAIGFLVFGNANGIHILPIIAVILLLRGLNKEKDPLYIRKNLTWKVQE
jgi:hypothetical protein